ncbi:MAG: glycosyltransferase [Cyanobacteria bacterium J06598_3]
MTPPITFFIPPALWPDDLPMVLGENWAGYGLGLYAWTVQTYLHLKKAGLTCQLTSELPTEGIVLCHSNALRSVVIEPLPSRLLICIKAEAPLSEWASLHIVQNPRDVSVAANRYYIPHWPQPQLIERDKSRGDRFETVAFFGHEDNLAEELRSYAWQVALAERGLKGRVVANTNHWNQYSNLDTGWNDYHDVDAVIAVRSFDPVRRWLTGGFAGKPPTKLYNAWLAGSIPILGVESAYREIGQRGKDYIEVKSFESLLDKLDRLKADVAMRRALMKAGRVRSRSYTPDKIVRKWQIFFNAVAIPAYAEWCEYSTAQRRRVMLNAKALSYLDRGMRRGQRFLLESLSIFV